MVPSAGKLIACLDLPANGGLQFRDAVGLAEPPARLGKAAGGDRIEPDIADAARGPRMAQQPVVMAGRFEHDDIAAGLKAGGKILQRLEATRR